MNRNMLRFSLLTCLFVAAIFSSCSTKSDGIDSQADENRFFVNYIQNTYGTKHDSLIAIGDYIYMINRQVGTGLTPTLTVDSSDFVEVCYTGRVLTATSTDVFTTTNRRLASIYKCDSVSVIQDTVFLNMAAPQGVKTPWVNGLRKALINMKEGGKALVLMGPSWGYGGSSSYTQSYASLSYEVQLIRVIKDPIKYDAARIAKCLKALGKTANDSVKGANNIYLFNETAGINDTLATAGDTVYLKYTGRLLPNKETISTRADVLSGTRFDHADSAAFVVGGSTVAGFNSAIQKIKPKSAGFFIIPYDKAYGIEGNTNKNKVAVIPQYNAIIFEYKVIRIAKIKKS